MQAALKNRYGVTATLTAGHGGVFTVIVDGKLIYDKDETYRFPTDQEIFDQIDALKKK
ncbi:MAG: hypothetical protein HY726_14350 [Candidatus Rokubacteria bacterium]|nr:hypothetical protein [Candidatus Rokubacteria bacterium]